MPDVHPQEDGRYPRPVSGHRLQVMGGVVVRHQSPCREQLGLQGGTSHRYRPAPTPVAVGAYSATRRVPMRPVGSGDRERDGEQTLRHGRPSGLRREGATANVPRQGEAARHGPHPRHQPRCRQETHPTYERTLNQD